MRAHWLDPCRRAGLVSERLGDVPAGANSCERLKGAPAQSWRRLTENNRVEWRSGWRDCMPAALFGGAPAQSFSGGDFMCGMVARRRARLHVSGFDALRQEPSARAIAYELVEWGFDWNDAGAKATE